MTIIVKHLPTREHYVLIGTGYGLSQSQMPSVLGGSLFPYEEKNEYPLAAVCDSEGVMSWKLTEELRVVSVDQVSPKEALHAFLHTTSEAAADGAKQRQFGVHAAAGMNEVMRTDETGLTGETLGTGETVQLEHCPGCLTAVQPTERVCPSCELVLIVEKSEENIHESSGM
ncbi:hypothetical protein [Marinicrinis sediminis]|uniref:Zinc ribbon domain-containing protein n=1 Tax=Marinicrinis sediminis TaxID=1652465 RepID=A0ABW5RDU5_9BACL